MTVENQMPTGINADGRLTDPGRALWFGAGLDVHSWNGGAIAHVGWYWSEFNGTPRDIVRRESWFYRHFLKAIFGNIASLLAQAIRTARGAHKGAVHNTR